MLKISSATQLIIAGALLFGACSESPKPTSAQRSMTVRAITAQYREVAATIQAPGSVQPRNRIALSSQINGFVHSVTVRAGDVVTAGQILITLDARDAQSQKDLAQASIDEAAAGLEEARKGGQIAADMRNAAKASNTLAASTFQRFQKLFDSKSVSPQELDEARARRDSAAADLAAKETMVAAAQDHLTQVQARMAQAGAQLRRADVLVGYTVLRAPASGKVSERQVDPGSAIFPGTPLMVLETSMGPQVVAEIPTAQIAAIHAGMEVEVRMPDSGKDAKGRIAEIIPLSDPATHTVRFKVDLQSGLDAPTGSFARVDIPAGTRRVLIVPAKAVREAGQLTGVFVVDDSSRARFRLVKLAPYDGEHVELLSGVEPGERIVSPVSDELTDGIAVEVRS